MTRSSPKVKIEVIPISGLNAAPPYQRPLNEARVWRMAENFDEHKVGVPEVANGNVVDGQHRILAAQVVGVTEIECRVHYDLTYEQEVALYRALNSERKALRPLDDFKAALEQKDPDALALNGAVEAFGFKVGSSSGPRHIAGIQALRRMWRRDEGTFRETLDLMRGLQDITEGQINVELMEGVQLYLKQWGSKIDMKRLLKVLRKRTPEAWRVMSAANVTSPQRASRMAFLIQSEYNARLGANSKLYTESYVG